jgi:hypothetical protein
MFISATSNTCVKNTKRTIQSGIISEPLLICKRSSAKHSVGPTDMLRTMCDASKTASVTIIDDQDCATCIPQCKTISKIAICASLKLTVHFHETAAKTHYIRS